MANISKELAAIMDAVYGQDVRSSIHDAIKKINDVSEVILTTGTQITSETSASTGFYESSLYLNTDTMILWKCVGTNAWANVGTLKGVQGDPGNKWYRGTAISAESLVYVSFEANVNDNYLNKDEGKIYHCIGINPDGTTNWSYDMTLSGGGGGGGASSWSELEGKPFNTLGDDFSVGSADELKLASGLKEQISNAPAWTGTHAEWESLADKSPYIGKRITFTDDTYSSICQTVTECLDSESNDDVVGASAFKEYAKPIDVTSEFNISASQNTAQINNTHIVKSGNCIDMTIRFTTPSEVTSNALVGTFPIKYSPIFTTFNVLISNNPSWKGTTGVGMLRATTEGKLELPYNTWSANTDVTCVLHWVINA